MGNRTGNEPKNGPKNGATNAVKNAVKNAVTNGAINGATNGATTDATTDQATMGPGELEPLVADDPYDRGGYPSDPSAIIGRATGGLRAPAFP
jgi:hypothetical protein